MRSKIKGVAPVSQEFQGEGYLQADGRQVGYLELMADLTVADNFVVGATDEASWMHLGDTDRTYIETIELLIPKLPDQNGVVICPGAQSQEEILGE